MSDSLPLAVEEAMNQVLAAEGEARQGIEACRLQAEKILKDARKDAGRIAKRTDQRIIAIQKLRAKNLKKEVEGILLEGRRALDPQKEGIAAARLQEAATALAAALTSP